METILFEIVPTLGAIRHVERHLAGWMRPQRRRVTLMFQPAKAWVRYEPLGVAGIISPWNYPLYLSLSPMIDALAAGNRVMLKPSELTPRLSQLLQDLIRSEFDESEVAVVTGGPDVACAFSSLPFDHLLFTGSTAVGRLVMKAAAENLTPVTLELGGKSPALVCPGYPLQEAARSISAGKFVNAGQTCVAPDYVLVQSRQVAAFSAAMADQIRQSFPSNLGGRDYSAIISDRQQQRLTGWLDEARTVGANILTVDVGSRAAPETFPPTLVSNLPLNSALMTEEIFGPILPIVGYENIDQALEFIASRPRPLALYCFSQRRKEWQDVLNRSVSGGVTINGTVVHVVQGDLPFGGIGPSGLGCYHGKDGFIRFSHTRAVHKIGPLNSFELAGPPWGTLSKIVARLAGAK